VPSLVRTTADLAEVTAALRGAALVGVDTEGASFHRYVDRLYLVQLSDGARTALLDPLALPDLTPLSALLTDAAVEKVFHDAESDLRVLDRDYGYRAHALFDTRIAAQLAGEPAVGLASLLEKYRGVKLSKRHQKADWSVRPLPADMMAYAVADVEHLPALRQVLRDRLAALGRLGWAEEEFARLEGVRWTRGTEADGVDAWERVKGVRTLAPRQLAAFRELHRWRDEVARRDDRAPFRVIGNDALLAVARALPATPAALAAVPTTALPRVLAQRHGPALTDAVRRALALRESALPRLGRGPRIPRDPDFDARVERLKAVRNAVAGRLGLDPGVLCGRPLLETVARARPRSAAGLAAVGELRRWQVDVLGDALLGALG
jgi:ribonuclease D